ncbi:MAG: DUF934 domain-containing protein [Pseudomonadota bacterium]
MDRLERSDRAMGEYPSEGGTSCCSLEEWRLMGRPMAMTVVLNGDDDIGDDMDDDMDALLRVDRITIAFPAFTDGRGFSLGRRLRLRGFQGELIASGELLPDQWAYLKRLGFTALESESLTERAELCLSPKDSYQADALSPLPLFRRRSN